MTAWTSPRTWAASEEVTAALLNAHIRDNELYLYELVGATGTAWTSYSPTFAGVITPGNGTVTGAYQRFGKTIHFRARIVFGNTSSVGAGTGTVTLPVTASSLVPAGLAQVFYYNQSVTTYTLGFGIFGTTTMSLLRTAAGGSYVDSAALGSSVPFSWTTSDEIQIAGTYEAA